MFSCTWSWGWSWKRFKLKLNLKFFKVKAHNVKAELIMIIKDLCWFQYWEMLIIGLRWDSFMGLGFFSVYSKVMKKLKNRLDARLNKTNQFST